MRDKLLTRPEEFVLLAIWKLQENAYSLPIRKQISETTGKEWSLGSIYTPIERLIKTEYLTSYVTDPTAERGGRKKRVFRLTKKGRRSLLSIHAVAHGMWQGVSIQVLETGR